MAEIINLRMARKAKARDAAEKTASENRVIHGQTKAEKQARKAEKIRAEKAHLAGEIERKREE
jgi:Domain of unknown function (DUF4169)